MAVTMNRDQLKLLMNQHSWSMLDVASICSVSPHTVRAWLRSPANIASRNMKAKARDLLQIASDKLTVTTPE